MNTFWSVLHPDKNLLCLKLYHSGSKLVLPMSALSVGTRNYKEAQFLHMTNVLFIAYHSWFSTNSVITDYIKNQKLNTFARLSSFNIHLGSILGFASILKNVDSLIEV
jgi:hypothetical protein